jgi:hypothetical protein
MIAIADSVPHRAFLAAMLQRHYALTGTPTVLVTTDPNAPVADTIARVILITDRPAAISRPTLVIGPTSAPGASHARLATSHPAELLSLIDGYLRHPERFAAGRTTAAAKV